MEKIAIMTDVNAGLDYDDKHYDITVLRSMINFGDEHYIDGVEIKKDDDDLWIANVAVPNREIVTVMRSAMQHWWKDICVPGMDPY